MAKKPITTLKEYFQTGKKPTESQFGDLLDSYAHLDGPQINKLIHSIDTQNGFLQLKTQSGTLVAQISLADIRIKINQATDIGWRMISLINGAGNFENGHQGARVKRRNGVVYLEGMLRSSNSTEYVAFYLEEEFRPKETLTFNCISNHGAKRVEIRPSGDVIIDFTGANTLSLGGINYLLE